LNTNIFKGDVRIPVILVQFGNAEFSIENPESYYTDFLNKEGFKEKGNFGSVRDFYVYNSMGVYRPSFDVYGPVNLSETVEFYDTLSNGAELLLARVVDSLLLQGVDFSIYDNDDDGNIEAISVLYAGMRRWGDLWPAMHSTELRVKDDFVVSRFSVVGEEYYISLFVHEFGHILGLPDLYIRAGITVVEIWSPMDNAELIPTQHPAVDRMLMGWLVPEELGNEDSLRLGKLDDNVAIAITNPENENEMFLLEYRTNKNWDIRQPSSGMLIWYVDYDEHYWTFPVNSSGCHAREYVVRAVPMLSKANVGGEECSFDAGVASSSDVFPGSAGVTSFDRFIFRNGLNMNITLSEITESKDKDYVTFKVSRSAPYMMEIESSSSTSGEHFLLTSTSTYEPYSSALVVIRDSLKFMESIVRLSEELKPRTEVDMRQGFLSVRTTAKGAKKIRLFSLNGQVLYESTVNGTEVLLHLRDYVSCQRCLLQITQGGACLYKGVVALTYKN